MPQEKGVTNEPPSLPLSLSLPFPALSLSLPLSFSLYVCRFRACWIQAEVLTILVSDLSCTSEMLKCAGDLTPRWVGEPRLLAPGR